MDCESPEEFSQIEVVNNETFFLLIFK